MRFRMASRTLVRPLVLTDSIDKPAARSVRHGADVVEEVQLGLIPVSPSLAAGPTTGQLQLVVEVTVFRNVIEHKINDVLRGNI